MGDVPINIFNAINKILLNGDNNGRDMTYIIDFEIPRNALRHFAINGKVTFGDTGMGVIINGNLLSGINGQYKTERENDILSLSEEEVGEALSTILNCGLNFVTAVRNLSTAGIKVGKILLQPKSNQGENNVVSRIKVTKSRELTEQQQREQQQREQQQREQQQREQRRRGLDPSIQAFVPGGRGQQVGVLI